ncbi:hypothetical protein [Streptomyces sp. NPDC048295]|uniref:hypothetical protein n=1 Tax=Streptomyces sp. NPDC048295 TaxID=3154617 RepID=UPI00342F78B2
MNLLQEELQVGRIALSDLTTEDAWLAFIRFGRRRLDMPRAPDADGLLFQYGTYSFDGPATFTLDRTRQFEINDSDGDHDHYVQVHCELRYAHAAELQALGHFESWFFHDGGGDLDRWTEGVVSRAAWSVVRELRPVDVKVYQERV